MKILKTMKNESLLCFCATRFTAVAALHIYILKIKDFMNLEYFVKKGNCLFDFRRIRRIRRYKTFHFGSIVVEKDKTLYLRSSFKVIKPMY